MEDKAIRQRILERTACILLALLSAGVPERAGAQYAVTSVTTSTTNSTTPATIPNVPAASGTLSSGLTYTYNFTYGAATVATANHVSVDAFVANLVTYTYSGVIPTVTFRRVDINNSPSNVVVGNRVSLWFERLPANNNLLLTGGTGYGGTAQLVPDYIDVMETLFAGRSYNVGIDNVFQNTNNTNNNNIERVDVVFRPGLQGTNVSDVGFAVFDRGNDLGNDPFLIAAIKTVDGSGNPLTYYPPVAVASGQYGSGLPTVAYHIMRKEATDAYLEVMTPNQNAQNRNGVFLTFAQLGIGVAKTTYGYSLFSPDVIYSTAADLVDWTNAAHFPNNTNLSSGGLDMVAVTGVAYTSAALVVLPVQVEDFRAQITGSKVQLNWQLGSTGQLKTTEIERSANGVDYSSLVDFSPPSEGPQTAYDEQPLPGSNYYRLKLVDYDGITTAYGPVCRVDMGPVPLVSVSVYPNPVKNRQFTLDAQGLKNEEYKMRLLDMNGKLLFTQKLSGTSSLKTDILLPGSLPPGSYTLQLTDNNGQRVCVGAVVVE